MWKRLLLGCAVVAAGALAHQGRRGAVPEQPAPPPAGPRPCRRWRPGGHPPRRGGPRPAPCVRRGHRQGQCPAALERPRLSLEYAASGATSSSSGGSRSSRVHRPPTGFTSRPPTASGAPAGRRSDSRACPRPSRCGARAFATPAPRVTQRDRGGDRRDRRRLVQRGRARQRRFAISPRRIASHWRPATTGPWAMHWGISRA